MPEATSRVEATLDGFLARAQALARGDGSWTPPPLRDAATVVLLRDGQAGTETYLMRRARTMAFAPGMHVFPGGRVDAIDRIVGEDLPADAFPFATEAARAGADEAQLRALVACAIREVEEEASVELGADGLVLIDHWITPEVETHRYDVRFFAAVVPDGQDATPRGTEADAVAWLPPTQALGAHRSGSMPMLPPTVAVLEFLADHGDAAAILAAGAQRDLAPRMPHPVLNADGSLRWVILNERTGAILAERLGPPEASEVLGATGVPSAMRAP
ncbi:MAG: NUDIX hydrolase [Actinomycetales bacterium]|nr:NUDIX hydrolase [Actinomycetales bacterium]